MLPVIHGRGQMSASRIVVYVAILAMYAISAVHSAAAWVLVKNVVGVNGQSLEAVVLHLFSNPLVEAAGIALPVNTFLADCILVSFSPHTQCINSESLRFGVAGLYGTGRP
jgi:hypothetical protein